MARDSNKWWGTNNSITRWTEEQIAVTVVRGYGNRVKNKKQLIMMISSVVRISC